MGKRELRKQVSQAERLVNPELQSQLGQESKEDAEGGEPLESAKPQAGLAKLSGKAHVQKPTVQSRKQETKEKENPGFTKCDVLGTCRLKKIVSWARWGTPAT